MITPDIGGGVACDARKLSQAYRRIGSKDHDRGVAAKISRWVVCGRRKRRALRPLRIAMILSGRQTPLISRIVWLNWYPLWLMGKKSTRRLGRRSR